MNEIPKYDLTILQGQDYSCDLIYAEDDETPVDVTGWTIQSYIRQFPEASDYFPFTCTADETGFHLTMAAAMTEKMTFSKGVYDVLLTDPDNENQTPLIYGQVSVKPRGTR